MTAPEDRIFQSAWRILTEFAAVHPEFEPQPLWHIVAIGRLRRHIFIFRIGGEGAAFSYFQGDFTPEDRIPCVLSKDGAEAGRIELEPDGRRIFADSLSFLPLDDQVLEAARLLNRLPPISQADRAAARTRRPFVLLRAVPDNRPTNQSLKS